MKPINCFRSILATAVLAISSNGAPVKIPTRPSAEEYSSLPRTGTGSVSGEVTARTKGGTLKSVAGLSVHLDPVTPYSIEVYKALREHKGFDAEKETETFKFDPAMLAVRRSVRIDNQNKFKISKMPDGEYFVACYVRWMVSNGDYSGSWHVRRVKIRGGQPVADIIL